MRFFLNFTQSARASTPNPFPPSSILSLPSPSGDPRKKNLIDLDGSRPKATHTSKQEVFIRRFSGEAILTNQITGVPASVTIAQAALESGWGAHAPGNNFFGIKGKGPAGSQWLKTREFHGGRLTQVRAPFRKYHDPLESFVDHAEVIAKSPYLKHAMNYTQNAEIFVRALQSRKSRYASDPHYVEKILSIITRYGLKKLDAESAAPSCIDPTQTHQS